MPQFIDDWIDPSSSVLLSAYSYPSSENYEFLVAEPLTVKTLPFSEFSAGIEKVKLPLLYNFRLYVPIYGLRAPVL